MSKPLTLFSLIAIPSLLLAGSGHPGPLRTTIQMERLAGKMEHVRTIHPDTADAIGRLLSVPSSACTQMTCSAQLRTRNEVARAHLRMILAAHAPPNAGIAAANTRSQ